MKTSKYKKYSLLSNSLNQKIDLPDITDINERTIDTTGLDRDVSEDFREPKANQMPEKKPNTTNWSEPEDRGEDLAEERDPFTQQSERNTQIPPELIQERAYHLYEQRGRSPDGDLADWFEAERRIREERIPSKESNY